MIYFGGLSGEPIWVSLAIILATLLLGTFLAWKFVDAPTENKVDIKPHVEPEKKRERFRLIRGGK